MKLSINELKQNLSKYISLLENGEIDEIEVTRRRKVVASISPKHTRPIFNAGKELLGDLNITVKDSQYDEITDSFYN